MKQFILLTLSSLLIGITAFSQGINQYEMQFNRNKDSVYIHLRLHVDKDYARQTYFLLYEGISIQEMKANNNTADYSRVGDTIFINNTGIVTDIELKYAIPISYCTQDGALIYRRENKWYPYRKNEFVTAKIYIDEPSYYIISGQDKGSYQEIDVSDELHLFLLSKEIYTQTVYTGGHIPFYFYINKKDTVTHEDIYFQEFINSYDYFVSFFDTDLGKNPLHVVEIFNWDFQDCQTFKNAIIFGNLFYYIYSISPLTSWIPHEIAHQWWGFALAFEQRGKNWRFLEESIAEYLKIQYIKDKTSGYKELLEIYAKTISKIEHKIPIQDADVDTQDGAWILYAFAPSQLEKMAVSHPEYKLNELIRDVFKTFEKQITNYEIFYNCINNNDLRESLNALLLENN